MGAAVVKIEKLVYGGHGLGRLDGRVVLAPYVLPGERVQIETVRETPGLLHARAAAWDKRSEERIEADCPVFQRCGGCHYQHIPYARQLEYKRQILIETLARVGKIQWQGPVETVAGEPWGYRNRTQLHILKRGRSAKIGFLEAGSHRLVEAGFCPINSPALNRAHRTLLEMTRDLRFPSFLREIEFFTNETDLQVNVLQSGRAVAKSFFTWCGEAMKGFAPRNYIEYPVGGDRFRVGSRSFFQVNHFLIEKLAAEALGDASGGTALDLYAGVGLFTLPLARRFEQTVAVDASPSAVRDLQFNAERAGVEVRVANFNVEEFLSGMTEPVDFAVADPPRAGLGPGVTRELLRLKPARLSIVSCDPATLARDLAVLTAGGYQIQTVTLVDLFPQTFHLESVVSLRIEPLAAKN